MKNFRNHGPTDPKLYNRPEYVAFSKKVDSTYSPTARVLSHEEFVALSAEAVKVKNIIPELRADIAYDMACAGGQLPEQQKEPRQEPTGVVKEIWDLFAELEVPDGHVVTREAAERGDFSAVDEKWDKIETLTRDHS